MNKITITTAWQKITIFLMCSGIAFLILGSVLLTKKLFPQEMHMYQKTAIFQMIMSLGVFFVANFQMVIQQKKMSGWELKISRYDQIIMWMIIGVVLYCSASYSFILTHFRILQIFVLTGFLCFIIGGVYFMMTSKDAKK